MGQPSTIPTVVPLMATDHTGLVQLSTLQTVFTNQDANQGTVLHSI
jgi:hypothetical protein